MSADNYYDIAQCPEDGMWYVFMGFMSDEQEARPSRQSESFATEDEAEEYAERRYTEYGVSGVEWPGWLEDREKPKPKRKY